MDLLWQPRVCWDNLIGLKRQGLSRDDIHDMRNAYRLLFANEGTQAERIQDVAEMFPKNAYVMEIINLCKKTPPGLCAQSAGDYHGRTSWNCCWKGRLPESLSNWPTG